MKQTAACLLWLWLGLTMLGCGPGKTKEIGHTRALHTAKPRPALEAEIPVLRWVPPDADLVLVGSQFQDLLATGQGLAQAGAPINLSVLGPEPFEGKHWAAQGVQLQASSAVYVEGMAVVVLLPLARDSDLVARWTGDLEQAHGESHSYRGHSITELQTEHGHLSLVGLSAHAALRVALNSTGDGWLDAILDASEGSAYSATDTARRGHAGASPGKLWGSASPLALLSTLAGGQEYLACTGLLSKLEGLQLSLSGSSLLASIHISPEAEATIKGLQSLGASEGMLAERTRSGFYASLAMDPKATATALESAQCPELARVLVDPLAEFGWSPPPRALHVAGTHFNVEDLSGQVALEISLHSKRFIAKQLDQIPMRSFFESALTLSGQRAKRLSIPTMSSLYYQLSNERLVFATKKGILSALLGSTGGPTTELAAIGVFPQKLRQTGALLQMLVPNRQERALASAFLDRLDAANVSLELVDGTLLFRANAAIR